MNPTLSKSAAEQSAEAARGLSANPRSQRQAESTQESFARIDGFISSIRERIARSPKLRSLAFATTLLASSGHLAGCDTDEGGKTIIRKVIIDTSDGGPNPQQNQDAGNTDTTKNHPDSNIANNPDTNYEDTNSSDTNTGDPTTIDAPPGICEEQHPVVAAFFELEDDLQACAAACHKQPDGIGRNAWYWGDNVGNVKDSFASVLSNVYGENGLTTDGKPVLSAVPLGPTHPGGIQEMSAETIAAIQKLTDLAKEHSGQIDAGNISVDISCKEDGSNMEASYFEGVETLPPDESYIRFLRNVAGGPLPEKMPNMVNDAQLKIALRQATKRVGFYDWLKANFNDLTLTRFYQNDPDDNTPDNEALAIMGNQFGIDWSQYNNDEVADTSQNHLAWLVRENLPITKLITDPIVVLPGIKQVDSDYDPTWINRLQPINVGQQAPAAGIVSNKLFLSRVPYTPTNLSRNRAYLLMKWFYDLDVFDVASQQMVGEPPQEAFPELTVEECAVCHQQTPLDSTAASLHNWRAANDYSFNPNNPEDTTLPPKMLPPQINGVNMPGFEQDSRLQWVMEQFAKDPKLNENDPNYDKTREFPFAKSFVKHVFHWLTGREMMKKPKTGEMNYKEKLKAYEAEMDFLHEKSAWFRANNYNLRELVVEIAASKYFRVSGRLSQPVDDSRAAEIAKLHPPFATPEILERRFRQLFGKGWYGVKSGKKKNNGGKAVNLFTEYRTDLGGIDSKAVQERQPDPSGQSELVVDFMAHDIGRLVAQEFSAPPAQRHLFKAMPFVKFLQPPANPITKVADPAVENLYRQQLSRIHRLACGKYHSPNSPEIDAALIRWKQLWLEGLESPSFPLNLTPNHQVTGSNVVQDEVVSDNNLLIRTWTAYLSFIMQTNDFRG